MMFAKIDSGLNRNEKNTEKRQSMTVRLP